MEMNSDLLWIFYPLFYPIVFQVKTRELETSQFVTRELEEKVKTTEDPYAWKSKLKEKERDIQVQERMNRSLFDEVRLTACEALPLLGLSVHAGQ
jgi:hypothetical protein